MTALTVLALVIGNVMGALLGAFFAWHILNAMHRRGWFY